MVCRTQGLVFKPEILLTETFTVPINNYITWLFLLVMVASVSGSAGNVQALDGGAAPHKQMVIELPSHSATSYMWTCQADQPVIIEEIINNCLVLTCSTAQSAVGAVDKYDSPWGRDGPSFTVAS